MALTDQNGTVTVTYDQDAFGNVLTGSPDGFHLTTKRKYTDIGLYYFYQRWYDPELARFNSLTPFPPFIEHPYSYCNNNATGNFDSWGLVLDPITWFALGVFCGYLLNDFDADFPRVRYACEYWSEAYKEAWEDYKKQMRERCELPWLPTWPGDNPKSYCDDYVDPCDFFGMPDGYDMFHF